MISYKEKGKAQIMIGGKDYGTVETGNEDIPGKVLDKISEALIQIQTGEQPHFNLVFGEGEVRRGITVVDGIVYAVEKNGIDMRTCRIDYTGLGLSEDAPLEEVIFEICEEIIRDCNRDLGKWAEDIVKEDDNDELKKKLYVAQHLKVVLDVNSDLEDERRYYNTPAYEKLLWETNSEIEMLKKSIGEKQRTAIMN